MLDHALDMAGWGFLVLPIWHGVDGVCGCEKGEHCPTPMKHPLSRLVPHGLKDATCQKQTITDWWTRYPDANIAVATGPDSGLVVIDADGPEGAASLAAYDLPATVTARSGRADGGTHYFVRHPGEFIKSTRILPGVDTRGDSGYVIVSPSRHASGNRYQWVNPPGSVPFARCPDWVIDLAGADAKKRKNRDDEAEEPEFITEARNIWITQQAGHLRRVGLGEEALLAGLRDINEQRCRPPLPDEEVVRIAHNAMAWDPEPDAAPDFAGVADEPVDVTDLPAVLRNAELSDTGNAEAFKHLFGDRYRYCRTTKTWYRWDQTHWAEDGTGAAKRAMIFTVRKRKHAAAPIANKAKRQAAQNHCLRSENNGKLDSALAVAGVLPGIPVAITDFDTNPMLLGLKNGVLDLTTASFRDAEPEDMISRIAGVAYDPEAEYPRWKQFLVEVFAGDETVIDFVQKAVGYSLTGDTREEVMFVCHGDGRNGKGSLLSVLERLLGDHAAVTPFATFDADHHSATGNELAILRGTRLVIASESEQQKRLAEARVKSITGNDTITCRFLYGELFSYKPQFKLWLATNHLPHIRGDDNGIWSRLVPIPFTRTFEGDEQDKTLKARLGEELSGILNWALEGCRAWQLEGLVMPDVLKRGAAEYRERMDDFGQFFAEKFKVAKGKKVEKGRFYKEYKEWCDQYGVYPVAHKTLTGIMRKRGFTDMKSGKHYWVGITDRDSRDAEEVTTIDNVMPAEDPEAAA